MKNKTRLDETHPEGATTENESKINNDTNNNNDSSNDGNLTTNEESLILQNNELKIQNKKYKNDIKLLKQSNNHYMELNQKMKIEYENKIQSLSKQNNNQQKSEQKINNEWSDNNEPFKEFFLKIFKKIKSNEIYYKKLIENEINNIDSFILIESIDDINEYIKPKNKIHANLILKSINKIRDDRHTFEQKLKTLNMSNYLDTFDSNGIFTLNEYNNNIKTINDLKNIINDNKACNAIFNSINNDNE